MDCGRIHLPRIITVLSSLKNLLQPSNPLTMKPSGNNFAKITVVVLLVVILYSLLPPSFYNWVALNEEIRPGWIHTSNDTYPITQSLREFVKESEQIYKRHIRKRDAAIGGRDLKTVDPWENPTFWNYFVPSIACPYPVTRVGYIGDGGKWICGLSQIAEKSYFSTCIIYSFGVGGDSSFEDELLSSTNCTVFAFDPTVGGININVTKYPGRVNFDKIGLGVTSTNINSNSSIKSLKQIMDERGHTWIDILKVDIEGAEFPAFDEIVKDFPNGLPFAHLSMELHLKDFSRINKEKAAKAEGKQLSNFWDWWIKLEKVGLRAFISEVNHLFSVRSNIVKPWLIEYSFINVQHVLNALIE